MDFYSHFGVDINDKVIAEFIESLGRYEKKELGDIYLNFKHKGISLCFKPSQSLLLLDAIFVYNTAVDGFSKYTGPLPHGISLDMTNSDIVSKLGEPEGKPPRGNVIQMFVDYKKLGLQVDFRNKSYEDNRNPITSICFYPPLK